MRTVIFVAALSLGLAVLGGCRTAPVYNVPRAGVASPPTISMQEMQEALVAGGHRAGWRMREVAPGQMRAEKMVGHHRALTDVTYDTAGYSVTLVSADNLLYDGRYVHAAYNRWVKQLQKSIDDEMRFRYP